MSVKPHSRSARHLARELAVQTLYAWLLSEDAMSIEDVLAIVSEEESEIYQKADQALFRKLVQGVYATAPELREQFLQHTDRQLSELSPVEHAILLLGSYELLYHIEVPYRVVINEAIEIAKSFGGTDGFKFINGVMDKLASQTRQLERQG